jgi:beta-phosphoglucomutase
MGTRVARRRGNLPFTLFPITLHPVPYTLYPSMLRAIIFDFDGILVDSEPLIMRITQQMAAQEGWRVSEEEYYRDFLGLDDRGIIEHVYASRGLAIDAARRDELVAWKVRVYWDAIREGLPAQPGAVEFVRQVSGRYLLAIASGSLRPEIEHLLERLGLRQEFPVLISAEDTEQGKPDPEIYLKALAALRGLRPTGGEGTRFLDRLDDLEASQCLVVEDAPAGIEAAHAAGMKCLALAHTRPAEMLGKADWVCRGFAEVDLATVEVAFR